jgi:hypothetical protein
MLVEVTQPRALCRSSWIFAQMNLDLLEFNPHAWKFRGHWIAQHRHSSSLANRGFLA